MGETARERLSILSGRSGLTINTDTALTVADTQTMTVRGWRKARKAVAVMMAQNVCLKAYSHCRKGMKFPSPEPNQPIVTSDLL